MDENALSYHNLLVLFVVDVNPYVVARFGIVYILFIYLNDEDHM